MIDRSMICFSIELSMIVLFSMLVMQFLVPILQIALFCLCVGRKLTDIPMGLVSREPVRTGSVTELVLEKVDKSVLHLVRITIAIY